MAPIRNQPPNLHDPLDVAWLAGLLEGEGCFTWTHNGVSSRFSVWVGGQDQDVIERAAALLGVACTRNQPADNPKPFYTCRAVGPRARMVMEAVLPLMGRRRTARIKELLNG